MSDSNKPSDFKSVAKAIVRAISLLIVFPVLVGYWFGAAIRGRDAAIESATQLLALLPGVSGQYLRRAFLQRTLAHCHPTALVEFGTIFSQAGARLEENAYVGPYCVLGLAHIERDVLVASGVQIPSGGATHYFDDPTRPIREQGGERRMVVIGEGAWIGSGAIILADVGKGTVVAAGAVVTKPLPNHVIAGGVPARVLRQRFESTATTGSVGENPQSSLSNSS